MKFVSVFTLAASVAVVAAVPTPLRVSKRDSSVNITDTVILNFALTLEHLENAFYREGLAQFDEKAFTDAGLPAFARGRFAQIGEHEAAHVKFLQAALGPEAVQPCNYSFPFTDPVSFVALSATLEGVGDSAYLGAAQSVTDKAALTAAASILSTEGRHQGWVSSAVKHQQPWSGAFDTPLDFNQVFSLAVPFITSCPSNNTALPFKAFPTLTLNPSVPTAGSDVSLTFNTTASTSSSGPTFLALLSGLTPTFINITNNTVTLPEGLQGTVYAVVTNNGTAVSDDSTLAGPAILNFPFISSASNPQ